MSLRQKTASQIASVDHLLQFPSCGSRTLRLAVFRTPQLFATFRTHPGTLRCFTSARPLSNSQATQTDQSNQQPTLESSSGKDFALSSKDDANVHDEDMAELGAMSRRLADLVEQSELDNVRPSREPVQSGKITESHEESSTANAELSFSEELKTRLEEKIKATEFESTHAAAISYSGLPDHVGKQIKETAVARPWTGIEATEDTVLRMLTDVHKPLKGIPTITTSRTRLPSVPLNLRPHTKRVSTSERLATARDRANTYGITKKPESEMAKEEREEMSRMFRERFQAGARPMPATLQGLTALANEKIEEAIARGLFKNLPKGKPIERDYHAESPFIDTTEYLLNRVIQRQDIVPPWIEKQQELTREVRNFRKRLRTEWKRHAVRTIASWGGGPDNWIRRAEGFAEAEMIANPDPALALEKTDAKDDKWKMDGISTKIGEPVFQEIAATRSASTEEQPAPPISPEAQQIPTVNPEIFRDSAWEKAELAYHELNITNLNNLTRSYNLIAPSLAQKPYYGLRRELLACYRDVAPTLPAEMEERANNPNYGKVENPLMRGKMSGDGGLLETWTGGYVGEKKVIYEERREKAYGFKEFWKDIFSKT